MKTVSIAALPVPAGRLSTSDVAHKGVQTRGLHTANSRSTCDPQVACLRHLIKEMSYVFNRFIIVIIVVVIIIIIIKDALQIREQNGINITR
jgi:hypothetical protein